MTERPELHPWRRHNIEAPVGQEGDRVEEFDELCEVQSDKAAVQITSQYAGIIMKLRHEVGDMVQVTL